MRNRKLLEEEKASELFGNAMRERIEQRKRELASQPRVLSPHEKDAENGVAAMWERIEQRKHEIASQKKKEDDEVMPKKNLEEMDVEVQAVKQRIIEQRKRELAYQKKVVE